MKNKTHFMKSNIYIVHASELLLCIYSLIFFACELYELVKSLYFLLVEIFASLQFF